jgi:CDP-alcohol phosphatidyltransferase
MTPRSPTKANHARAVTRWIAISAGLSGGLMLGSLRARRRHGAGYFRRHAAVSSAVLGFQHAAVGWLAIRRHKTGRLPPAAFGIADTLTLARGAVAAHLVGIAYCATFNETDQPRGGGWASLEIASTALDWLDGPLARRFGAESDWGGTLDLETDSWLTLCAACAACSGGRIAIEGSTRPGPAIRFPCSRGDGKQVGDALLVGPIGRGFPNVSLSSFTRAYGKRSTTPRPPWGRPPHRYNVRG